MSHTADRLRLKDKIVSNVAKAIKAIQQYQYTYAEEGLVLTNTDWQCHKLCENLDHALLHGLRHITNGYWRVIKEYTRKGTIKEIERLNKVTTDLGRGRAWLYYSLNECLLESYIRCLTDNEKQMKKYYVKEALVLDQQRMNVLLTLTSGLDFVTFQLEPNCPYLDLGTCPPKPASDRRSSQEDRVSLHSMDSITSSRNSALETSTTDSSKILSDSDTASLSSLDTTNGSTDKSRQCSISYDSGCHLDNLGIRSRQTSVTPPTDAISNSSQGEQESRLKRIESIPVAEDVDELQNDFEIIRVKSKNSKTKSTKRKKISKTLAAQSTTMDIVSKAEENNNFSAHLTNDITVKGQTEVKDLVNGVLTAQTDSLDDTTKIKDVHISDFHDIPNGTNISVIEENSENDSTSNSDIVDSQIFENGSENNHNIPSEQDRIHNAIKPDVQNKTFASDPKDSLDSLASVEDGKQADAESIEELPVDNANNSTDFEIEEDVYKMYHKSTDESNDECLPSTSQQRKSALEDYVKFISGENSESVVDGIDTSGFGESDRVGDEDYDMSAIDEDIDYNINIDNNTMLHVMLEIFQEKDENFKKLLSCRQGQTEGDVIVVFILITDRRLYVLHYKNAIKRFIVDTSVAYKDIDFIVHSINYQVINVVCANKRKQFWLTTGDETLSRLIVQTMCDIIDSSDLKIKKLAVFDDATTQKICLKKYIRQECHCEESDAIAEIYSLVYWEDPHSGQSKSESCSREGMLYQREHDSFKGTTWRPVYVILRDGILCIFNNKSDSKPQSYLRMGGDQCVGCRRSQSSERANSLEIVLASGDSWTLSADDHTDLSMWLLCMCRAVSEGMQPDGTPFSCLPCCAVVTNQKILMCHEDVQTSFFRTLGSANIEEVTGITQDQENDAYCVVEFDSQDDAISSEEWVLYFNSPKEKKKFGQAVSLCWRRQFQVDLPINNFDNITLEKRCQETAKILRNSLIL
ncbi:hypothetical protein SNE40_014604 [Patella caerulea]|uniref:Pleckstrin homology domain-containing family M member 2 n=1 Tax=Patella caerulea TaxID=87958 RepID=A0AAN8JF12_PATCE